MPKTPKGGWAKFLSHSGIGRAEWFARYNRYLRSRAWEQRRAGALKRAGGKCQLCGSTGVLHAHHVTYLRVGCEEIVDLRVLCQTCHRKAHESGEKHLPLDRATREEAERRAVLRLRSIPPPKKRTRRPKPIE